MISKCPKCGNSTFEVENNSPSQSNYQLMFVQCSSCGSVVGVMDFFNIGQKVSNLETKVEEISSTLDTINNNLLILDDNIRRIH